MHISLTHKRLDLPFLFCLTLALTVPSLLTSLRLMLFPPLIIIACYRKNVSTCLWIALGCGLIVDLLSSNPRLGIHSLNYCLTLMILYSQKKNFFADSLSTLPIMTYLFSAISTLIMALLLYILEIKNVLSWNWVWIDLLLMSSVDAVYGFCCFILPSLIFGKPKRRGSDYFLNS